MLASYSTPISQPIPPLIPEEEDQIIHTRITNDERPLRRVIKKFYNYTSVLNTPIIPLVPSPENTDPKTAVEDAREAFLIELSSFRLTLQKSVMICDAEARQVEEYQRERQRIEDDHGVLRGQIEQLKTSLEHAQMLRRRKIEYDSVAEKVNTLPSRDELQGSIEALENDIIAIRAEHETQNVTIQSQKVALDSIISQLGSLRFLGKDDTVNTPSPRTTVTPAPEPASNTGEDIEMGEVEEPASQSRGKKKREEELEEGEATDGSSELSEVPDDI